MADSQHTLDNTIQRLRMRILDFKGRNISINEQNTKTTLINPLLVALGWDIEDLDEVSCEYKKKPQDNPVDYALFLLQTPCLFVEAKALGSNLADRRWVTQTLSYAAVVGVEWCILTDGNDYRLYNAAALVDAEEKLFRAVTLTDVSIHQRTLEILQLLSRENMRERRLSSLWKSHFIDRRVKEALSDMIKRQDRGLIRLLNNRVDGLTTSELRDSLQRAELQIAFSEIQDASTLSREKGKRRAKPKSKTPSAKKARKRPIQVPVGLENLVYAGVIKTPFEIESTCLDRHLVAKVLLSGAVEFGGQQYTSLSEAAGIARNSVKGPPPDGRKLYQTNGWTFWKFRDTSTGKLVELNALRRRYLASHQDEANILTQQHGANPASRAAG
jgi:predicted type IV restriction endonuclease